VVKGNNGGLIKDCLRRRWWWTVVDEYEKDGNCFVNMMWTQKNKKNISSLVNDGRPNKNKYCCLLGKEKYKSKLMDEYHSLHMKIVNQGDYEIIKSLQIEKGGSYFCVDQLTDELDGTEWFDVEKPSNILIPNHFENVSQLSDKTLLFKNMRAYYEKNELNVFSFMP
jgi:hypothetical protein